MRVERYDKVRIAAKPKHPVFATAWHGKTGRAISIHCNRPIKWQVWRAGKFQVIWAGDLKPIKPKRRHL